MAICTTLYMYFQALSPNYWMNGDSILTVNLSFVYVSKVLRVENVPNEVNVISTGTRLSHDIKNDVRTTVPYDPSYYERIMYRFQWRSTMTWRGK